MELHYWPKGLRIKPERNLTGFLRNDSAYYENNRKCTET